MHLQPVSPTIDYVISDQILIEKEQDILHLLGESQFHDLILHDYNFPPEFFDLSTKILGNVLQKLTNYQVRLAIIGDFSKYTSKVLADFIRESNRQQKYVFVNSLDDVKKCGTLNINSSRSIATISCILKQCKLIFWYLVRQECKVPLL